MEEVEVPIEQAQEQIHHVTEHARGGWISGVALASALLAAAAAVAALLAGHHANEAMIEQIHASDHWSYYQAKGIKSAVLSGRIEVLEALGKNPSDKDREKLEEYKKEQAEIAEKAGEEEKAARTHLGTHQILARAVTFFQVAIAIAAISVLTRRRRYWLVSMLFGMVGLGFLLQGICLPPG